MWASWHRESFDFVIEREGQSMLLLTWWTWRTFFSKKARRRNSWAPRVSYLPFPPRYSHWTRWALGTQTLVRKTTLALPLLTCLVIVPGKELHTSRVWQGSSCLCGDQPLAATMSEWLRTLPESPRTLLRPITLVTHRLHLLYNYFPD